MKILFNVDFWTSNDVDMYFACFFSFYNNKSNILRKKYNQLFIRNFYKL